MKMYSFLLLKCMKYPFLYITHIIYINNIFKNFTI